MKNRSKTESAWILRRNYWGILMKKSLSIFVIVLLGSCESIPEEYMLRPVEVSKDPSYGYTQSNPVKVGGVQHDCGPLSEREYLLNLRNIYNERPQIQRIGTCCPFETLAPASEGHLDLFRLIFTSTRDTVRLYLNMYEYEQPKAPKGFRLAGFY